MRFLVNQLSFILQAVKTNDSTKTLCIILGLTFYLLLLKCGWYLILNIFINLLIFSFPLEIADVNDFFISNVFNLSLLFCLTKQIFKCSWIHYTYFSCLYVNRDIILKVRRHFFVEMKLIEIQVPRYTETSIILCYRYTVLITFRNLIIEILWLLSLSMLVYV